MPYIQSKTNRISCFLSKLGVGNVRPAGRIRPAEGKRPAPKSFLNLNGIRPADKIDPARKCAIRPARHLKNLYEIRKYIY